MIVFDGREAGGMAAQYAGGEGQQGPERGVGDALDHDASRRVALRQG